MMWTNNWHKFKNSLMWVYINIFNIQFHIFLLQIWFFVNIKKVTYNFCDLQHCRLGSFQFVLNRYIQIPQNYRYFSFQIIYFQQLTSTWGNVQTQPGQHSCFHSYRICETRCAQFTFCSKFWSSPIQSPWQKQFHFRFIYKQASHSEREVKTKLQFCKLTTHFFFTEKQSVNFTPGCKAMVRMQQKQGSPHHRGFLWEAEEDK